jgi:hypothetical protein
MAGTGYDAGRDRWTQTGLVDAVRKDVHRSLAGRRKALGDNAHAYLDLHVARLERLLTGVWDAAVAGDVSSSLQALRLLTREQRLQGLDTRPRVWLRGRPGAGRRRPRTRGSRLIAAVEASVKPDPGRL